MTRQQWADITLTLLAITVTTLWVYELTKYP